jgi:hypothetical protein
VHQIQASVRFLQGYRYLDKCGEALIKLENVLDKGWLPVEVSPKSGNIKNDQLGMTVAFSSEANVRNPFHLVMLLLRMHVCGLGVPVRILAMVLSRGSVLLRFFMISVIVVMGRLAVVMRRRLMLRSGIVMMFAGSVSLFLCHGNFLLQRESMTFQGKVPV